MSRFDLTAVRGPFVRIATICEELLHESSGARSLFRIIDGYSIENTMEDGFLRCGGTFVLMITDFPPEITEGIIDIGIYPTNGSIGIESSLAFRCGSSNNRTTVVMPLEGFEVRADADYALYASYGDQVLARVEIPVGSNGDARYRPHPQDAYIRVGKWD